MMSKREEEDQSKLEKVLEITGISREEAEDITNNVTTQMLASISMIVFSDKEKRSFVEAMRLSKEFAVKHLTQFMNEGLNHKEGLRRYVLAAAEEIKRQDAEKEGS